MVAALLRIARVIVAQIIGVAIATYGGLTIPYLGVTIGALINGIFKFIRDRFPKSEILSWLPL
jgi:hypothetical protein